MSDQAGPSRHGGEGAHYQPKFDPNPALGDDITATRRTFRQGDGDFKVVDGEILEVEPERRLAITWSAHWDESVNKDRASRVTYELSAAGTPTRLRLVHDDFDRETATYAGSVAGWLLMLSSLKSILETGKPLQVG